MRTNRLSPSLDGIGSDRSSDSAPGKHTLTERLPVQRKAAGNPSDGGATQDVQGAADRGVSGAGGALPHLDTIQKSFGPGHDLSGVRAHVGGPAADASKEMGASAYATGDQIGFAAAPSLHLAAH